jgi:hypothetical protein
MSVVYVRVCVCVTGNDTKKEAEEVRQAQAHQIVPTTPSVNTFKTTIHFYDQF